MEQKRTPEEYKALLQKLHRLSFESMEKETQRDKFHDLKLKLVGMPFTYGSCEYYTLDNAIRAIESNIDYWYSERRKQNEEHRALLELKNKLDNIGNNNGSI